MDHDQLRAAGFHVSGAQFFEFPVYLEPPLMLSGGFFQCRVGRFSIIHPGIVGSKTVIGRYSQVATSCQIGIGGHPTNWLSTHFFQYRDDFVPYPANHPFGLRNAFEENQQTIVGSDCWIAAHCVIRSGVTIGDGAIVGAGSVVVEDVPPFAIVGGVPAKVIRYRFAPSLIDELLELHWWDLPRAAVAHLPFDRPEQCAVMIREALQRGEIDYEQPSYASLVRDASGQIVLGQRHELGARA
jgi:virginiamycin A acetyltransferase